MNELVSLIVPVYNGRKYAEQCVKMLTDQTYKDLEILIINDGSSDDTTKEFRKYIGDDQRFRIIDQQNGGVSKARNTGIREAKGEFISFIDVDDYVFPDYVDYLINVIKDSHADIACGNYIKVSAEKKVSPPTEMASKIEYNQIEAVKAMLYRKNLNSYPVVKLIRSRLVKETLFVENVAYGEDTIFNFMLYQKAGKVVYTSKVLYLYLQQPGSANHQFDSNKVGKSWEEFIRNIMESEFCQIAEIKKAALAKGFVFASDLCCRIHNTNHPDVENTLIDFINDASSTVLQDKECKRINRIMALAARINSRLYLFTCRRILSILSHLKIERRKSL